MFQDFSVLAVDTDLKTKSVLIEFNLDIASESVNDSTINIFDRTTKNTAEFISKVNGKSVVLELIEWPTPNVEYIVKVQKLKSILGDELPVGFRKSIKFASAICTEVDIISPAFDEVIDELKLEWKEVLTADTQKPFNAYYIEIAKDPYFNNIVKKTNVEQKDEIVLTDVNKGQYFVRCRVQDSTGYGKWSEVISFIFGDTAAPADPIYDDNENNETPDEPIYVENSVLNVTSQPIDGETPSSILIEFDGDIDIDSINKDNIVLIRRTI
jgi:hypothetical protein